MKYTYFVFLRRIGCFALKNGSFFTPSCYSFLWKVFHLNNLFLSLLLEMEKKETSNSNYDFKFVY